MNPCYHFCSPIPHSMSLSRCQQNTFRCKGRALCMLTARNQALINAPLFTHTAQKPSSVCFRPSLSAYPGLLCRTFTNVLSSSLRLHIHVLHRSISGQELSREFSTAISIPAADIAEKQRRPLHNDPRRFCLFPNLHFPFCSPVIPAHPCPA